MKRSRFSEEQIIGILKEHEAGVSVADLSASTASATPATTSDRPPSGGLFLVVPELTRSADINQRNVSLLPLVPGTG